LVSAKENKIVSIIYLDLTLLQGSNDLPPGIGRAILKSRYTWSFNP